MTEETLEGAVLTVLSLLERSDASGIWGVPTGFVDLDRLTGGLHPAELTVLAARPSLGKTSFALQVLVNNALEGRRVLFYETEMALHHLVLRIASQLSGVSSWSVFRKAATEEERERWVEAVRHVPSLLRHSLLFAGKTWDIDDLFAHAVAQYRIDPYQLLIVDHLNRLLAGARQDTYVRATYVAVRLKELANTIAVPILCLAQLNRRTERDGGEIARPGLADLRESGRIEEEADNVWLLFRQRRSTERDQIATIEIEKNRNGPVGTVELGYRTDTACFYDLLGI